SVPSTFRSGRVKAESRSLPESELIVWVITLAFTLIVLFSPGTERDTSPVAVLYAVETVAEVNADRKALKFVLVSEQYAVLVQNATTAEPLLGAVAACSQVTRG